MSLPRLLLTRPQGESERLAEVFAGRAEICVSPLLRIEPLASPEFGEARGLILTSANAVRAAGLLPSLPCYVVGERTAALATDAGGVVTLTAEDADALVARLTAQVPEGPLLHLRGEHARGRIAERLGAAGILTRVQVIYRQPSCPLRGAARHMLEETRPVVVPLYSPRTAALFRAEATGHAPLYVVALSPAVAEAFGSDRAEGLRIAARPDGSAMEQAIAEALAAAARLEAGGAAD